MDAYVIDTDIATYILQGRQEAVNFFAGLQAQKGGRIFFSEITRAELLSTPGLTQDEIQQIEALMECATEVITVDSEISTLAGKLRGSTNSDATTCPTCGRKSGGKLRLPDSVIAATAGLFNHGHAPSYTKTN